MSVRARVVALERSIERARVRMPCGRCGYSVASACKGNPVFEGEAAPSRCEGCGVTLDSQGLPIDPREVLIQEVCVEWVDDEPSGAPAQDSPR